MEILKSYSGILTILISILFLITLLGNFILAIILLPIIFFVKKGNRKAIVSAGIYAIFLTLVNAALYIESNRNEQGDFYESLLPIYIYLGLLIYILVSVKKAYIAERNKKV